MAKRKSQVAGMNLDSLMDTLTNVVGILLIILIFTVLSGVDAVKRIKNFVDEITVAQLEKTKSESAELRKQLEQLREQLAAVETQTPDGPASIERAKLSIEQLKADLEKLAKTEVDPESLAKQIAERQQRTQTLEGQLAEQQKTIADLKARLAENVAAGPELDAKVVNLPDPKEAPQGSQGLIFLCRGGQIVPLDAAGLQAKAMEVVKKSTRALVRQDRIDCAKLTDLFEKQFVGDRYCQLKVRVGGDARPYLAVFPRKDAGLNTAELRNPKSALTRSLRETDPQKFFLDFRVWSDSFETYLEARNMAAKRGVLAGWIPYVPDAEYWIGFPGEMKLLCLGKEPPPPPPAVPAAAGPVRPPPPPDVVD